jgi:predicted DNA-binding protein with PD1-like motif
MSKPTFNFYPSGEDVLDVLEQLTQEELEHLEQTKATGIRFWTDAQMATYNVKKQMYKLFLHKVKTWQHEVERAEIIEDMARESYMDYDSPF